MLFLIFRGGLYFCTVLKSACATFVSTLHTTSTNHQGIPLPLPPLHQSILNFYYFILELAATVLLLHTPHTHGHRHNKELTTSLGPLSLSQMASTPPLSRQGQTWNSRPVPAILAKLEKKSCPVLRRPVPPP